MSQRFYVPQRLSRAKTNANERTRMVAGTIPKNRSRGVGVALGHTSVALAWRGGGFLLNSSSLSREEEPKGTGFFSLFLGCYY